MAEVLLPMTRILPLDMSVTTTKLRVVLNSGLASVGVIQWVVPSIPSGG